MTVAHVVGIGVHPVKSTATRSVVSARVVPSGLASDREWMVVDAAGTLVSARQMPALFTVTADTPDTDPSVSGDLRLGAPGAATIDVSRPDGTAEKVRVFGTELTGIPAPPEATAWVREVLGRDDIHLVRRHGGERSFVDSRPVTIGSMASLRRLDAWVAETARERGEEVPAPLAMHRFRPSLTVDGDLEPFAEDQWRRVRVGEVVLGFEKAVARCVMTTIDPATGAKGKEPIRTLARHRAWEGATHFCIHLRPLTTGVVHVGDTVTVEE